VRVTDGAKKRDALKDFLEKKGIMSRVYFDPVHLTWFYRQKFGYKGGELPVTEKMAGGVLNLPLYPDITHDEIDYVAASVAAFF
jgi:dTDP-4-amino-4,6-dideoxygalactose transaminase